MLLTTTDAKTATEMRQTVIEFLDREIKIKEKDLEILSRVSNASIKMQVAQSILGHLSFQREYWKKFLVEGKKYDE